MSHSVWILIAGSADRAVANAADVLARGVPGKLVVHPGRPWFG